MTNKKSSNIPTLYYTDGWKYRVYKDYTYDVIELAGFVVIEHKWFTISEGKLYLKADYMWDGPSGPTYDTPAFIWASAPHDVIYQCIREGLLPIKYRRVADNILSRMCQEAGMNWLKVWVIRRGVRKFAAFAVEEIRPIREAP